MNFRQQKILDYLSSHKDVESKMLHKELQNLGIHTSLMTLSRDLLFLQKEGCIQKHGKTRAAHYNIKKQKRGNILYSLEKYFYQSQDARSSLPFSLEAFDSLRDIFTPAEKKLLNKSTIQYQKKVRLLASDELQREIERLTIDLSWKSSQIEGNTYDLIDTEMLIKEHQEARGHTKYEANMILNHKTALDVIFAHPKKYLRITQQKIENLHETLVKNLGITPGLRSKSVRIIGSNYIPPSKENIEKGMKKLLQVLESLEDPLEKSFAFLVLSSYLQPFRDGNKRTARILSNAILLAHKCCPLSYRSVDATEYKKALLIFYEQQSFANFKALFLEQYIFATENYFQD